MEVQSFLDVVDGMTKDIRLDSFSNDEEHISANDRFFDKLTNISSLYSMSFYQELIPEIFKYWHKSEFSNDFVDVKDGCIWFRGSQYTIRTDKNNPLTGTVLMKPRTIDDFINDCHRAGIELFWKEEISNKYFKR